MTNNMDDMTNPKDLYKVLSADFESQEKYDFSERGEGMMRCRQKGTNRTFLMNNNTEEAWEILNGADILQNWDTSDIDMASVLGLPEIALHNAFGLRAPYYFDFDVFKDGVAHVSWMLQPDGLYYADDGGFGMEDDVEINFGAFIDSKAKVIVPFQKMDRELRERYREQAVEISRNPENKHFVCLDPDFTIPVSQNTNLKAHKDKLRRIFRGVMLRFNAMLHNPDKHIDSDGKLVIFAAINPNLEHYLCTALEGKAVEGKEDTYDVSIFTGMFTEGEISCGGYTNMGSYTLAQLENVMFNEENVDIQVRNIIKWVKILQSHNVKVD